MFFIRAKEQTPLRILNAVRSRALPPFPGLSILDGFNNDGNNALYTIGREK